MIARAGATLRDLEARLASYRATQGVLFALCIVIALHCALVVGYIGRQGRLAIVPLYDDAAYLVDGIGRLRALDNHGLLGLLGSFRAAPPHAPYASIIAALGFAITPSSPWGAYLVECLWVPVILALAACLLRGLPTVSRCGVLLAIAAVPMLGGVIGSFRPDVYWGLLTGLTATLLAVADLRSMRHRAALGLGVLVGLTILSKPTGMAGGLAAIAAGTATNLAFAVAREPRALGRLLLGLAVLAAAALVTIAPYLAVAGADILQYVLLVMVDQKAVWGTKGSLATQLAYYLRPGLFWPMMGWPGLAVVPALLGCLGVGLTRRHRARFAQACAVAAALVVAYLVPALSPVKSNYIGALFYGMAVAAAVWALGVLILVIGLSRAATLCAGAVLFLIFWKPQSIMTEMNDPAYIAADRASVAVLPSFLAELRRLQSPAGRPVVYTSTPGPVYDITLQFYAELQQLDGTYVGDYATADWPSIRASAEKADIVIASEAGSLGQGGGFAYPGIAVQNDLIRTLDGRSDWRRIETYTDPSGHHTVLFSRVRQGGAG